MLRVGYFTNLQKFKYTVITVIIINLFIYHTEKNQTDLQSLSAKTWLGVWLGKPEIGLFLVIIRQFFNTYTRVHK